MTLVYTSAVQSAVTRLGHAQGPVYWPPQSPGDEPTPRGRSELLTWRLSAAVAPARSGSNARSQPEGIAPGSPRNGAPSRESAVIRATLFDRAMTCLISPPTGAPTKHLAPCESHAGLPHQRLIMSTRTAPDEAGSKGRL